MKISKKVLSNKLRIVTIPMKDNPTVTVLVLVSTGSKYEKKKLNGISHFLEHMCFKGTEKRPTSKRISSELDSLGSAYNAFTSHEYTGYYAKADAQHFKKIFDIITDIYLYSSLPEKEIEKEKGVIIEEINMYQDMPHRNIQDLFLKLLYGDTPSGRNILGEKKTVQSLKREDLLKYKKEQYTTSDTVLVVVGNISEKEVINEAKKVFGKYPTSKKRQKEKIKEHQKKPAVLLEYKKTDQAHFVLGFRTYGYFDKRTIKLSVLGSILAGGMSSRLFEKLREEMGVGYYINAGNDSFSDHGFFQISAGVDKKRIEEVIEVIINECKKLKEELIPEDELKKAKEIIIGNMKFSLESTDDIASFYGGQEVLKKELISAEDKARMIREVSSSDLKKIANDIFRNDRLNLALIGPFKDKQKFLELLKF